jgi:hypothetical protein
MEGFGLLKGQVTLPRGDKGLHVMRQNSRHGRARLSSQWHLGPCWCIISLSPRILDPIFSFEAYPHVLLLQIPASWFLRTCWLFGTQHLLHIMGTLSTLIPLAPGQTKNNSPKFKDTFLPSIDITVTYLLNFAKERKFIPFAV